MLALSLRRITQKNDVMNRKVKYFVKILTQQNIVKAGNDPKGKDKATSDADLCIKFIAKNLQQLLKSKKGRQSLLLLSQESLLRLLDSDDLVLRSEYELLLWVAAWANYQIEHEGEKKNVQKANTEPEENKTTEVVTGKYYFTPISIKINAAYTTSYSQDQFERIRRAFLASCSRCLPTSINHRKRRR